MIVAHLVNHSGGFHADELLSSVMLTRLFPQARIGRMRDADWTTPAPDRVSYAVGRDYDPARLILDHHQKNRPLRDDGQPYSSFGLIWRHFGGDYLRAFGERNATARINRNAVTSVGHDKSSEIGNAFRQVGVGPGRIGSIASAGAAEDTQEIGPLAEAMGDVGSDPGAGNLILAVEATKSQMIGVDHAESVRRDKTTDVRGSYTLDAGRRIEITAGDAITIKVGASLLTLDDSGSITVNGVRVAVTMDKLFDVMSDLVKLN